MKDENCTHKKVTVENGWISPVHFSIKVKCNNCPAVISFEVDEIDNMPEVEFEKIVYDLTKELRGE